jgi:phosphatidylinositol-3-phosphatase
MKLPSLAFAASLAALPLLGHTLAACGGGTGGNGNTTSGTTSSGNTGGGNTSSSSGNTSSGNTSSSSGNTSSSSGSTSSGSTSSGTTFPAGTICNAGSTARMPPQTVKHLIVIMEENENFGDVSGQTAAPYINQLANECAYASAYYDNTFPTNLVSLPHYLALTSGSNCDTGLGSTGTGCITDDNDATSHTLSTTSIFQQATSWKAYAESMPSACDQSSNGEYAAKHNPAVYYTQLTSCSTNALPIAALTCNANTANTPCGTPSNAFTQDLANDTLAQLTFISPNLLNDMHDGTITQADNWLLTYLPLVFKSAAYLRGEVAVLVLWDEQETITFGGAIPNVFISPYIKAGTTTATVINHFAVLKAMEKALGIGTFLGCASGTQPGSAGGACPTGSTADVRALLNW